MAGFEGREGMTAERRRGEDDRVKDCEDLPTPPAAATTTPTTPAAATTTTTAPHGGRATIKEELRRLAREVAAARWEMPIQRQQAKEQMRRSGPSARRLTWNSRNSMRQYRSKGGAAEAFEKARNPPLTTQ